MKQLNDFTTKDWCIMMGYMFCAFFLMGWGWDAFLKEKDYSHGILHILGAAGWLILYFKHMKKVEKKNE